MEEYNLSLTELDETQNHDDFHVVWFSLNDIPKFLTKFADSLKKFSSIEDCMSYMQFDKHDRSKLVGPFDNIDELINRVRKDILFLI